MANGSDFDPILMANSVAQLTQSVKVLGDNMEDMTNRMVEAMERVKKSVSDVGDEMEKTADRGASAMITKFSGVDKVITGLQRKLQEIKGWAPMRAAGAVAGAAGWAGGKAMGAAKGALGAVGLGSGAGMLSWMMRGYFRGATYAAEGQKVAQMLDQVGGVTEKYASRLGVRLRQMSVRLGREVTGDLKAGMANFAAAGFGEEEILEKTNVSIRGLKDNALEASMGLDMFFEVGAGTTAKNAATLAVEMNMSLREGVNYTQELYIATRNWGVSYGAVIGAIMQTTSALRLMGVERGAVLDAASGLVGGFAQSGIDQKRAGALAMGALGQMGGAFANMPMGWQAYLGQDVAGRLGQGDISHMEAIYRMNTGFGGLGKPAEGQFEAILGSVTDFARTRTGGKEEDMYMMLTQGMGFSKQVAMGIIALDRNAEGQRVEGKQRNDILNQIRKAFDGEGKKEPPQVKLMRRLNDTLAKVGGALLMSIVGGFASLYGGVLALYGAFTGEEELRNRGRQIMGQWASPTRSALDTVMSGMGTLGKHFGEGAALFDMRGRGDSRLWTKEERERRIRDRAVGRAATGLELAVRKRAGIKVSDGKGSVWKEFHEKVGNQIRTKLPELMAIEDAVERKKAIGKFETRLASLYSHERVGTHGATEDTVKLRKRMGDDAHMLPRMIRRAVREAVREYSKGGKTKVTVQVENDESNGKGAGSAY